MFHKTGEDEVTSAFIVGFSLFFLCPTEKAPRTIP